MHAFIYIYICIYIHIRTHTQTHTHIYTHMHIHIDRHIHLDAWINGWMNGYGRAPQVEPSEQQLHFIFFYYEWHFIQSFSLQLKLWEFKINILACGLLVHTRKSFNLQEKIEFITNFEYAIALKASVLCGFPIQQPCNVWPGHKPNPNTEVGLLQPDPSQTKLLGGTQGVTGIIKTAPLFYYTTIHPSCHTICPPWNWRPQTQLVYLIVNL